MEVCAMPTVIEPKTTEAQPEVVSQLPKEPELFAAEVAMEEKSSSVLPLLLVFALIAVVGGTIFYFIKGANAKLNPPVATTAVNEILKSQGNATIRFSTGTVTSSVNEKPMDPHYKLLVKAGVLTTKPKSWNSIYSSLTPAGEKLLSTINGVDKAANKDGSTSYVVPLATRKLVEISNITMIRPHLAQVDYAWKWDANRLGKEFDASGDTVKSFNTWDRGTLIKSYGVDFYSAAPTRVRVVLMETKDGIWKPYVD
jgi:hypothetical protein